jgi:hypothetical protein
MEENYSKMKAGVLLTLIALMVSIVVPLSITLSHDGSGTFLVALDICGAANPAVSADSTMPGIHERPCTVIPGGFVGFTQMIDAMFHPLLIAAQEEHPPRI